MSNAYGWDIMETHWLFQRAYWIFEVRIYSRIDVVVEFLRSRPQHGFLFFWLLNGLTRSKILAPASSACVIPTT